MVDAATPGFNVADDGSENESCSFESATVGKTPSPVRVVDAEIPPNEECLMDTEYSNIVVKSLDQHNMHSTPHNDVLDHNGGKPDGEASARETQLNPQGGIDDSPAAIIGSNAQSGLTDKIPKVVDRSNPSEPVVGVEPELPDSTSTHPFGGSKCKRVSAASWNEDRMSSLSILVEALHEKLGPLLAFLKKTKVNACTRHVEDLAQKIKELMRMNAELIEENNSLKAAKLELGERATLLQKELDKTRASLRKKISDLLGDV